MLCFLNGTSSGLVWKALGKSRSRAAGLSATPRCAPTACAASLSNTASTGGPRPWSKGGGGGNGVGWSHGAGIAKGAGGDAEGGADRMRHTTEPVPKQLQQAEEGEWEGGETGRGGPCGQPFQ